MCLCREKIDNGENSFQPLRSLLSWALAKTVRNCVVCVCFYASKTDCIWLTGALIMGDGFASRYLGLPIVRYIYGPELGSATILSEEKRELAEFIRNYEAWHVEEFPMWSMQNPGENEALVKYPWLMGGRKIWILAGSSIAQKS